MEQYGCPTYGWATLNSVYLKTLRALRVCNDFCLLHDSSLTETSGGTNLWDKLIIRRQIDGHAISI